MPLWTQIAVLSVISFATGVYFYRPVHLICVRGVTTTIYWTTRSWLFNYPVTPDYSIWNEGYYPGELDKWLIQRKRVLGIWEFLRPFFSIHGYELYKHVQEPHNNLLVPPKGVTANKNSTYPYAKNLFQSEEEAHTDFVSPKAWPARDTQGREVYIKSVTAAELKAFQLLHSKPLCRDPRNRTIPIIEYLVFDQQTFIVMPRWSISRGGDFVKAGEILRYARDFMEVNIPVLSTAKLESVLTQHNEAVVFLHENKIAHGDINDQNIYMDVLVPWKPRVAGVYGPDRKYALIDFETVVLPMNDGSYSPKFEKIAMRDVYLLSRTLSVKLGCIKHIVPEMSSLMESMKSERPPTVVESLSRFDEIVKRLTPEDLELPVDAWDCFEVQVLYRKGSPIYREM